MSKKKVWTIAAGGAATAAILVPGIVYASSNGSKTEGEGINVPALKTSAELPKNDKTTGPTAASAGHTFSATSPTIEKNDNKNVKNVESFSPVSAVSANTDTANSPVSPVSANTPASPVSAQSPASADTNTANSPVSAASPSSAN